MKCTKLQHMNPSSVNNNGVIFGHLTMTELANNPRFLKFASMYSYFKVHKMRVEFNTQGQIPTAISAFDPDSDHLCTEQGHPKPRAALAACLRRPDPRPPRPLPRRDVPVLYLLSDAVSLSHTPKSFYLYLLIPHNLANVAPLYWGAISFPKTIYVQYSVPNIFISCISSSE